MYFQVTSWAYPVVLRTFSLTLHLGIIPGVDQENWWVQGRILSQHVSEKCCSIVSVQVIENIIISIIINYFSFSYILHDASLGLGTFSGMGGRNWTGLDVAGTLVIVLSIWLCWMQKFLCKMPLIQIANLTDTYFIMTATL